MIWCLSLRLGCLFTVWYLLCVAVLVACLCVGLINGVVYCVGLESLLFYRLVVVYFCGCVGWISGFSVLPLL